MKKVIPKYYDPEKKQVYLADSCVELRKAWMENEVELNALVRGTYPGKSLVKDELEGVKSIGYWDIKKPQGWGLDWHTNEGIELCFLESGNLSFLIDKDKYHLQPGDLTITRPWISHMIGDPAVDLSKLYWLILDVDVRHPHQEWKWPEWIILNQTDIYDLTRYLRQNEQPIWFASPEICECFASVGKIIRSGQKDGSESRLKILVNNLFILLLELFRKGDIPLDHTLVESKRTVQMFLNYLETSLNESWSLEKMADYCRLGPTRLTHYFNEIVNCSPMEYLNLLRLNSSARLLKNNPGLAVTDVAYRSGFSSPQYFNSTFKKHFRITPLAYRKQLK